MTPTLLSKAEFSRLKGWNKSTATRYATTGKIVLGPGGLVDVEASERRLAELADASKDAVRDRHARDRELRRRQQGEADNPPAPNAGGGGTGNKDYRMLQKYRAESETHRAALLRMEREEKEGRLVDAEAVRRRAFEATRSARNAILNLPHRIDPLLAGEADSAKRAAIWERETRRILDELSRGCGVTEHAQT